MIKNNAAVPTAEVINGAKVALKIEKRKVRAWVCFTILRYTIRTEWEDYFPIVYDSPINDLLRAHSS